MGSYNVTCCLTKTPILEGTPAVLMVFQAGDTAQFDLLGNWDSFLNDVLPHLKSIHFGKYADCGKLDTTGKIDVNPYNQDQLFGFFMTRAAWDFCSSLKSQIAEDYISQKLHMLNTERKFYDLIKERPEPDSLLKASLQIEKFQPHSLTIAKAYAFGISNLINIFEPGMYNMYAGQSWDTKMLNQWQELRQKHLNNLPKRS
jgi:hypothetical protein